MKVDWYLSHQTNTLYAGTQGKGLIRSIDGGDTWDWYNDGLFAAEEMIIAQIEIDFENNNVYTLLSGDYPEFDNQEHTGVYLLDVAGGASSWSSLRGTVHPVSGAAYTPWIYPTCFAVDFSSDLLPNRQRSVIWL